MNLLDTLLAEEFRRPLLDSQHKKVVCVDFDGVLNDSSGPYHRGHFGPPIKQGLRLLRMLQSAGYTVVVLTARKETDLVQRWLSRQGFYHIMVTNHKIPARAYIDDRALPWGDDSKAEDFLEYVKSPKKTLELKIKNLSGAMKLGDWISLERGGPSSSKAMQLMVDDNWSFFGDHERRNKIKKLIEQPRLNPTNPKTFVPGDGTRPESTEQYLEWLKKLVDGADAWLENTGRLPWEVIR